MELLGVRSDRSRVRDVDDVGIASVTHDESLDVTPSRADTDRALSLTA